MFIVLFVIILLVLFLAASSNNKYPKLPPRYRKLGPEQLVIDLLLNKYDLSFDYISEKVGDNIKLEKKMAAEYIYMKGASAFIYIALELGIHSKVSPKAAEEIKRGFDDKFFADKNCSIRTFINRVEFYSARLRNKDTFDADLPKAFDEVLKKLVRDYSDFDLTLITQNAKEEFESELKKYYDMFKAQKN